jgi:hypothetical protein
MRGPSPRRKEFRSVSSRARTVVIGVAAVAAAVVLFVVLQDDNGDDGAAPAPTTTAVEQPGGEDGGSQGGGGSQEPEEPAPPTIVLRDGQPVGGAQELEFAQGDRIRFVVESDTADEIHLHGYNLTKNVAAGGKVTFDVPATIEGVFEAESHHSGAHLADITVTPG